MSIALTGCLQLRPRGDSEVAGPVADGSCIPSTGQL